MVITMRKLGLALAAAASLCMTACGTVVPDMTEEQNSLVVEYAAGLLLKYDKNFHGRLVDIPEPEEEPAGQEPGETPVDEQKPEEEQAETVRVVDVSEEPEQEPEEPAYRSIEEFYGIGGVEINYTGYELKDRYPDDGADDLFFAMGASDGCKLMVLHFDVKNISGQDVNLDMMSLNTKFKISINGESPKYALTTMLINDLASYAGTVAAGTSEQLVLIAEVQEQKAQSVQTLALVMKNVAEEATISLN